MPNISPHAIIDPHADLAGDVTDGPFTCIGPHVRIEAGCRIAGNVTIVGRTTLGAGARVYPMSVIGSPAPLCGDDSGECILGEANAIREHVTISAGRPGQPTRIGNHNLIMIACSIGPGAQLGNQGIFDNLSAINDGAIIEDYVRMSGCATVAPGVRVGAYSFVAGYTLVEDDAPPYAMLQGTPVRVRGINSRNLKACGFGEGDIHALKSAFRDLFDGGGSRYDAKALAQLEQAGELNACVRRLAESLRAAQRRADQRRAGEDQA